MVIYLVEPGYAFYINSPQNTLEFRYKPTKMKQKTKGHCQWVSIKTIQDQIIKKEALAQLTK